MSEKTIIKSIEKHINSQNNEWKFIYGKEVLTKQNFVKKLNKDKKFRAFVVNMVINLSVDILTRKGEE